MSDERREIWTDEFNEVLKGQGLFVRDYDQFGRVRPYQAAEALHRMVSAMDKGNARPWLEMTVRELVNLYGETSDLRTFHRIETEPNVKGSK